MYTTKVSVCCLQQESVTIALTYPGLVVVLPKIGNGSYTFKLGIDFGKV